MAGETVRFEGEKRLARQLRKVDVEAGPLLRKVHLDAAGIIAEEARRRAPVHGSDAKTKRRAGRLRASIRVAANRTSGLVKIGSAGVPYAGPIVGGWPAHDITANRFPWEALDDKRGEVIALHAVRVSRLVDETITKLGPDV